MSKDKVILPDAGQIAQVIAVDLPLSVYGAIAQNTDGTYTGYVNAKYSKGVHWRVLKEFYRIASNGQAARPGKETGNENHDWPQRGRHSHDD